MMRVVNLPFYEDNPYQRRLAAAETRLGIETVNGGGGGNFLRTALKVWKPDILHFHWLHPYLLRPGVGGSICRATRFLGEINLLRLAGSRIVWTVHNLVNHDRLHERLERFYCAIFAKCADGIIVHSHASLSAARKQFGIGRGKLTAVIPQGSYVGCYPNTLPKAECRKQLGLRDDPFVFVFLGRIEPYKGVLKLVGEFRKRAGGSQLVIAGRISGAESLRLIQAAIGNSGNIHLHPGFVPDDRIQVFLNAADAYVYPAREILNSGSISLAMSFGLPCVAPRLPAITEMLGGNGGVLYDPEDPSGLREALDRAIGQRAALRAMGEENLMRASAWTWEKTAQQTRDLYRQLLLRE